MEEQVVKQLNRQLKLLNFWITLFGTTMIVGFIIVGILVYKVVTFTHDVSNKFTNLQTQAKQSLDVKQKLCDTKNVGSLLQTNRGL